MVQIGTQLTLDTCGANADVDLDPSLAKALNALARYEWVRIGQRYDDAGDARLDNGVCTWACLAVVATRFERGVHRCATSVVAGLGQSIDLGVGPAVL
jgi:hypothetical protein